MTEYYIILYKNGLRKRLYKSYKRYAQALAYYNKMLADNKVLFEKKITQSEKVMYELCIMVNKSYSVHDQKYEDLTIKKKEDYKIEETILRVKDNKRYTMPDIIKKFIKSKKNLSFFLINNKFIIQSLGSYDFFVLKDISDAKRFYHLMKMIVIKYFSKCGHIFIDKLPKSTKLDIIDEIVNEYNISRYEMIRQTTKKKS